MSSDPIDCSVIEERINGHTLYISTTQEQMNKLNPDDPDVQNKRDALTRKLNNLHEQLDALHRTLEECRQGKAANLPDIEYASDSDVL
jgi:small-conductance mechanosensitive channel